MLYITAIRQAGGGGHEHITRVKWLNSETGKADDCTTQAMIEFIEKGNKVQVGGNPKPAYVGVVDGPPKYLRTFADKQWNDNLLALPKF
jgi:hypothetical protein